MFDNVTLLKTPDRTIQDNNPAAAAHDEMLATYARFYRGLAFQDRRPAPHEARAAPQQEDMPSGGA
jgi:hypothetical protein